MELMGTELGRRLRELAGEPVAEMYMPYAQQPEPNMALMIRTAGSTNAVSAAVRREVLALDPRQPVYSVRTLPTVMSEAVAKPRCASARSCSACSPLLP